MIECKKRKLEDRKIYLDVLRILACFLVVFRFEHVTGLVWVGVSVCVCGVITFILKKIPGMRKLL